MSKVKKFKVSILTITKLLFNRLIFLFKDLLKTSEQIMYLSYFLKKHAFFQDSLVIIQSISTFVAENWQSGRLRQS